MGATDKTSNPNRFKRSAFSIPHIREGLIEWQLVSVTAARAPSQAQAGAKREGKTGISDGRDVAAIEKIIGLRVDIEPAEPLVAASEIEFRVTVI